MILLTGGAGYIGSHANKMLNTGNCQTIIYDNLSRGHRQFVKWGQFVQGDLGDKDLLRCVMQMFPIDAVMHYASFIEVGESVAHPSIYFRNNVVNTLNLLDVMAEYKIKYLIFSSSCALYGNPLHIPIQEDHRQQPINPYGRCKWMVEQVLQDYEKAYGLRHVCLRYFNAAGADPDCEIGEWHEPETHLVPLILQVASGLRSFVEIYGTDYDTPDGTCIRDYVHVNDLASAHILAMEHLRNGGASEIFNLANTRGYSVKDVVKAAKQVTGMPIDVVEKSRREGDPAVLVGNSDKARKILGWKPQYADLIEIVQTAWTWEKIKNRT